MREKFYTVDDISKMLDMHPKTLQRYIREGKLRAVKVGKAWRISGHDLSLFMESSGQMPEQEEKTRQIFVTSVVDIDVVSADEAMNISNMLGASLNSKPSELGSSCMSTQYIDSENKLRIVISGSAQFMEIMMSLISNYIND